MEIDGAPVYRCSRDRDDGPGKLYLYRDAATEVWTAASVRDGDNVSAVEVKAGMPAFKASGLDDVRTAGDHSWHCFDAQSGTWWAASTFDTTHL